MKTYKKFMGRFLGLLIALALPVQWAWSLELPIRVSVNFILNSSGNRPATGDINTDAEVNAQVERANEILKENGMEYKFQLLGINEISGQSAYYNLTANAANRDSIRTAAMAAPGTWNWRTDAVNMYINGYNGGTSAISKFPPDNDIVLFNQYAYAPLMLHEVGHSVNLLHTHQSGGDGCSDTLPDNSGWSRDQIAINTYGVVYASCTAGQQALVDNTWENVMSYHDVENAHILTPQQGNRTSAQTYTDRNWLLTDTPVYVKVGAPTVPFVDMGSWSFPYPTVQAAMNAGEANNRTLILMNSSGHANPTGVIDTNTDIITRRGSSVMQGVSREYEVAYGLESSTNIAVAAAVLLSQNLAREGDEEGSLEAIVAASEIASGKERQALLLEIGDRMKAKEKFGEADRFYSKAVQESDQPGLKKRYEDKSLKMKKLKADKLEKAKKDKGNDSDIAGEEQP